MTSLAGAALAGCSSFSPNPVEWWHGLEGGPLAQTRPPPPKADAPYPSLGAVPAKPAPPDLATRNRISSGLVADRANAQYTAGLSPLQTTPPHAIAPPPKPAGPAAGDDQSSNATLQAANAPSPPRIAPLGPPQPPLPDVVPNPPRPAPVGRVVAAPLPPLEPPAPVVPAAAPDSTPATVASAPVVGSPAPAAAPTTAPAPNAGAAAPETAASLLPGMPENPPPMVRLPGVALPSTVAAAPAPSTPPPPPAPAPPPPPPGQPVTIAFAPGSAALPPAAVTPLKQLAQRHGGAAIVVTGFGEAESAEPAAQSAALPLALARARSIAAELFADGVPPTAVRLGAQAQGAGGAAQILSN